MNNIPNEIKKLDNSVINRIAAGEVIQRPANALKELIENCLDAQATNIRISVKEGGLKLLQIQDNGIGIRKEDFEIVCERFTTSKLRKFEDLEGINTYGFRGEALASISYVSHINILSKTATTPCAFQASYKDGTIIGNARPIAGNQGTTITVADLFYNMNVRKAALRSPAEEFAKICDVVGKYAIHNANVGFNLKNGDTIEMSTMQNSDTVSNIRIIFGQQIAKDLVEFYLEDNAFNFKVSGQISNVNYSCKKMQFVLFINHRLVECQNLKRRISQIYTTYLPKNAHPFIYLSLEIKPSNVDVNVHPTKHEVHFLNEEQIVDLIGSGLEAKLLGSNNSRTFYTQAKLPVTITTTNLEDSIGLNNKTIYDKDLVRTDPKQQKLEKFICTNNNSDVLNSIVPNCEKYEQKVLENSLLNNPGPSQTGKHLIKIKSQLPESKTKNSTKLQSVLELRAKIENYCFAALRKVFAEHVFVGVVSNKYAAIQHDVQLLLVDTQRVLEELFYQCIMFNFENFNAYRFDTPLSIVELAKIALDDPETGWTEDDGNKNELAERVCEILLDNADMLRTYFQLHINTDGYLCTLPILIDGHMPCPEGLPRYILKIACDVNWEEEQPCFESFAHETAEYYAMPPSVINTQWRYTVEHVLYPFMKEYLLPPSKFQTNAVVLQAASLPELYKVFERC